MLACEESRTQEVESPLAVDGYSQAVAENLWVPQCRLTHAVLHQAGVRTVHNCRGEQRATLLTWTVLEQLKPTCHDVMGRTWDSLQVTWAANSALIQIMSQHNGGEFLQMEWFFCELISPAALFRALFHLFLFSEAPLFGWFCCLTFRFWGMCVRKCVSLYKCHLLWAKKASSLWMIIAEGKRRTERVNEWVKMNYFNWNSSWAAIAKLYWTALASVQNVCVCVCVCMWKWPHRVRRKPSSVIWSLLQVPEFCSKPSWCTAQWFNFMSELIPQTFWFWMNVFILAYKLPPSLSLFKCLFWLLSFTCLKQFTGYTVCQSLPNNTVRTASYRWTKTEALAGISEFRDLCNSVGDLCRQAASCSTVH